MHRTSRRIAAGAAALALLALTLTACAAGADTSAVPAGPGVAGFWLGLWHGLILPITFIVSLFNHAVGIYEIHNNGGWYDFGFVLGALIVFSGPLSSRQATRSRSRAGRG